MTFIISTFQANFNGWWLRYFWWNSRQAIATAPRWWLVNIGSGNGLVPSGIKPLPELMLTQFYVVIWRHNVALLVLKLEYPAVSRSIPWLLLLRFLGMASHHQLQYWMFNIGGLSTHMGKLFNILHHPNIKKWSKNYYSVTWILGCLKSPADPLFVEPFQ